ncbi:glycosidase [Patescibacteria group bacterium]
MAGIKLTRSKKNPLLKPIRRRKHLWWESGSVFNPGVVVKGRRIYLLYRAIGGIHYSHFGLAILKDPTTIIKRFSLPVLEPEPGNDLERFGVEDPRIVFLDNKFQIIYTAASIYSAIREVPGKYGRMIVPWKVRCSLVVTSDFRKYERKGVILPGIDSKDGTLFPAKINDQYVLLHRPFPDIWISFSPQITEFGSGKVLCRPRSDTWDNDRIGAGAPPLKTPLGWLEFYHGIYNSPGKPLQYMMGILLLDLENPTKILYRSQEPVLVPEEPYEKKGYIRNVVFGCGAIEWKEAYYLYYGAADKVIGVASIPKDELLSYLAQAVKKGAAA